MITKRAHRVRPSRGFDLERRHPDRAWLTGCAGKPRYTSETAAIAGRCHARSADFAASAEEWTPARRRVALLSLEPLAMRSGWSIGVDEDHCPSCAAALELETGGAP